MRHTFTALMFVGVLAFAPVAFAQASKSSGSSAKHAATAETGSHSVHGVVKSIDDSTLVVTPSGKKTDMTFVVNQSTTKEGSPAAGSMVSVRYKSEAGKMVATAVQVTPAHSGKTAKKGK